MFITTIAFDTILSFLLALTAVPVRCYALSSTTSATPKIRVAVYQPPVNPLVFTPTNNNNPLALLTQAADALRVASVHGVNLVLFPELFLPGAGPSFAASESDEQEIRSIDRDGYELNIIGNLCAELGVACVTGYAEKKHESEGGDAGIFSSAAAFNFDGSRSGNCRRITSTKSEFCLGSRPKGDFLQGHALVETLPITIRLSTLSKTEQEIKVGILIGDDVLVPEQCRHIVRSGAETLLVLALLGGRHKTQEQSRASATVRHVLPTRAIENSVPVLFSNYVGTFLQKDAAKNHVDNSDIPMEERQEKTFSFIGSSTILDQFGEELVRAPCEENGDMPCDSGYLLPCEVGELYAVDLNLQSSQMQTANTHISLEQAGGWNLSPSITGRDQTTSEKKLGEYRESRGFSTTSSSKMPSITPGQKKTSEKRKRQKRSKYYPWTG